MGGSPKQIQTTHSATETNPWDEAIPGLKNILGQIGGQLGNTGVTGAETGALNSLTANAQAGNPYAGQIGMLAGDLLRGGTDRTGMVGQNYADYKTALMPYATADTNPYSNEAFRKATDFISSDIMDRIKAQYAGAGYSPTSSGDFSKQVSEGISRGVAPTWLQAYNDNEARKLGAIGNIFTGGASTAGMLSGLDQTALANRQAGVGASTAALQARDSPYERMLQLEQMRRGIPLQNIGQVENLKLPIAQLGGRSVTDAKTTQETKIPLAQQLIGGILGGAGLAAQLGGFGPTGWLLSSGGSGAGMLNSLGGFFGSK